MTMVTEETVGAGVPKLKRQYRKRNQVQKGAPQPKRLHLRELLAQGLPIWVLNNTVEFAKQRKVKPGTVTIQVGEGENRDKILVPPGSDPICLSDQVDVDTLKKCRDLFKAVDHGVVLLLDPDKAEEYYARNETRRGIVAQKIANEKLEKKEDALVPDKFEATLVEVDPNVIDICLGLKHKAENRTDAERVSMAMERLNERAGTYSEEDLNYLLNNGKFAPVKTWAKSELKKLNVA
jgi:hypothetical protein